MSAASWKKYYTSETKDFHTLELCVKIKEESATKDLHVVISTSKNLDLTTAAGEWKYMSI